MFQHWVVRKAELAVDAGPAVTGLHALERQAVIHLVDFHAVEHPEKIKVPPGAAEFAIGRDLQSDLFLLLDDRLDLAVFHLLELGAVIAPFSRFARASFKAAVRNRLPTTSARNGGLFLGMTISSCFKFGR